MAKTERVLKPANDNPWYVLMTLYGEQDGEELDEALHEENRAAWNTWAAQASPSKRDEGIDTIADLPSPDAWHTRGAQIRTLFENEFSRRNPHKTAARCPEPTGNEAIEMKDLEYPNQLCISRFFIPRIIRCNGSLFQRRVVAQGVVFFGFTSFSGCQFRDVVTFQNSRSYQMLDFGNSDFCMGLNLQSITCVDLALIKSRFKDTLLIADASCSGLANMCLIKPLDGGEWNLLGFQFSAKGSAYFSSTEVKGDVDFRQADFEWNFDAVALSVSGNSDFGRARFARDAYFSRSKLAKSVSFFKTVFIGRAYFDGVLFNATAPNVLSFQDCGFKEPATFREAQFAGLYPDFSGATLNENTTFTDNPANWPTAQGGLAEANARQAKASCAVIRHSLGKQGLPEAEHFFFRREMAFARKIGGSWERLPYRLFGAVSDYGYSIARPARCLFWVWFLSALTFVAFRVTGVLISDISELLWSGALSFANLFPVLGFHRVWFDADKLEMLSPWLKALSGAQTVVSLPLLFFLGLGLRTRFRMR